MFVRSQMKHSSTMKTNPDISKIFPKIAKQEDPSDPIPSQGGSARVCADTLTGLDAFLYGIPGGLILSGMILFCFVLFGNALINKPAKRAQASMSSLTRMDRKTLLLGKKNRRGPPPSQDLRPMDMKQLALREDAPDDIKAMALAGRLPKVKLTAALE